MAILTRVNVGSFFNFAAGPLYGFTILLQYRTGITEIKLFEHLEIPVLYCKKECAHSFLLFGNPRSVMQTGMCTFLFAVQNRDFPMLIQLGVYRVTHILVNLGWVDLDFACSNLCPILLGVNPTQVCQEMGHVLLLSNMLTESHKS